MGRKGRRLVWTAAAAAAAAVVCAVVVIVAGWRDRPGLDELPWSIVETLPDDPGEVSVTWLGITSLLFDDGDTQILVDGTFTRLSPIDIALARPVRSDLARINYVMDEYRIDRLAAIVPVHAHFDHAMDVGRVANRSTALVVGTESIANIARGADVPVNQFQILRSGEKRVFGNFTITILESRHVPWGPGDEGWPAGIIEEPLQQPARFWSWRAGMAVSILLSHPSGTSLIQGSAGFLEGMLDRRPADVVFLSVAGLAGQGRDYARQYWDATVTATGASEVIAMHFDDPTRPFGQVALLPKLVDDVVTTAGWINEFAEENGVDVHRAPFGRPVKLY
ncbi:MAG: hypothetical protein R3315_08435 [Woeseiaceae bacterium]|nr:hypothetical protein [Woeseiaceae bacterium]